MPSILMKLAAGTLAILAGAAIHAAPLRAASPPDGIHAGYVLLAQSPIDGTVPLARVIVAAGRQCPRLAVAGDTIEMTARVNPHPDTFPVEVCEAKYPFGQHARVLGSDISLPAVEPRPVHIIAFGDTGCAGGAWQDCTDPAAWPFPALAAAAAERQPDLIVHVGDYNYRGTPGKFTVDGVSHKVYDAGDNVPDDLHCRLPGGYASQNVPGSDHFDNWEDWRLDFFEPARPLLLAAPWVFVRGNHELCSRAGLGWFYFLDPGSDLLGGDARQRVCASPGSSHPQLFTPPYSLDLGALRLVVMDTANACDAYPNYPRVFAREFAEVRELAAAYPSWLLTHRPIWGMSAAKGSAYQVINRTLQQALDARSGGGLPPGVRLVLAGHMHRFQSLGFDAERPPQLIVGNGGVGLVSGPPTGRFTATVDGARTEGFGRDDFGFLEIRLDRDGAWEGSVVDPLRPSGAQVLAVCGTRVSTHGAPCAPPQP